MSEREDERGREREGWRKRGWKRQRERGRVRGGGEKGQRVATKEKQGNGEIHILHLL